MLVNVTGFTPVAVFFTDTVALAVGFTTILLNVTLEGVRVSVGAAAAAHGTDIRRPASSATMYPELFTNVCAGRNRWTMTRRLMTGSTNAKMKFCGRFGRLKDPGSGPLRYVGVEPQRLTLGAPLVCMPRPRHSQDAEFFTLAPAPSAL